MVSVDVPFSYTARQRRVDLHLRTPAVRHQQILRIVYVARSPSAERKRGSCSNTVRGVCRRSPRLPPCRTNIAEHIRRVIGIGFAFAPKIPGQRMLPGGHRLCSVPKVQARSSMYAAVTPPAASGRQTSTGRYTDSGPDCTADTQHGKRRRLAADAIRQHAQNGERIAMRRIRQHEQAVRAASR